MNKKEFKTVFLGSQGIGKTCILQRIVFNQYECRTAPTIGSTFSTKSLIINGEEIVFQLWDTAGQEQYRSLTKIYYQWQESQIALLVYDVTKKETFQNLQKWYEELKEYCDKSNMILILCGNKIDLDSEQISYSEAKRFAEKIQAELFLVSAKTGEGIQGLILFNIREMFDQIGMIASQKYLEDPTFVRGKSKTLYQANKKKKCC